MELQTIFYKECSTHENQITCKIKTFELPEEKYLVGTTKDLVYIIETKFFSY